MSKFDGRINALEARMEKLNAKINIFISNKDFALIRDYYKALLDEKKADPEVLQRGFTLMDEIERDSQQFSIPGQGQKIEDLKNDNVVFSLVFYYRFAAHEWKKYKNGCWMPKKIAMSRKQFIKQAKVYLKKNQKD